MGYKLRSMSGINELLKCSVPGFKEPSKSSTSSINEQRKSSVSGINEPSKIITQHQLACIKLPARVFDCTLNTAISLLFFTITMKNIPCTYTV